MNVVQYFLHNWEKAKQFFSDVLDWPVVFLDEQVGWMEFGEEGKTHLAINRWEDAATLPPKNDGAPPPAA